MAAAKTQSDDVSDDLDYEIWAPIAKATLEEKGLWNVVDDGVPPDPTKVPGLAASIQVEDLCRWRDCVINDMKALKVLQSSLPDSAFRKTVLATSAKELWDLLKLLRLEKHFEELSLREGETMDYYLDRFLDITDQFRRLGNEKSDYQVITKFLSSLSREYDGVASEIEGFMDQKKTRLHDVVTIIDLFGLIPRKAMPDMLRDTLKSWKTRLDKWCDVCNLKTYTQAMMDEDVNEKHLMLTESCGDFTFDEDMWMIYPTITEHLTPHDKLFTTLDRKYSGFVGLTDGSVVFTEGIGDVVIIKEGKKKTLKNVLFAPSINRNVLSVRKMTRGGYSLEMGGGECTIRDEYGKVFGKTRWEERGFALRLQVIKGNSHNQEVCHSISKAGNLGEKQSKPRQGECDYSGEQGHCARDCKKKNLEQALTQAHNEVPEHELLTLTICNLTWDEDMWMVYTAASDHMTPYDKYFTTLNRTYRGRVMLGNGSTTMAEGKGDVKVKLKGEKKIFVIKNVLFVPRINRNVLSVGQMTSRGHFSVSIIGGNECIIKDETGKIFAKTMWEERGFALRFQAIN